VRFEARSVARLGGDEFCAMLEGVADAEEAEDVASRVAEQLVGPYSVGGHECLAWRPASGWRSGPPARGSPPDSSYGKPTWQCTNEEARTLEVIHELRGTPSR
jgi:GGDEF domain-containing protein